MAVVAVVVLFFLSFISVVVCIKKYADFWATSILRTIVTMCVCFEWVSGE